MIKNAKKELVFIFFSQFRIILLSTVIIFVCAVLIAFFWPPTYSSFGKILVKGKRIEKSDETLEVTEARFFELTAADLFSEIEIIKSKDTLNNTIKFIKDENLLKGKKELGVDELKNNLKTQILPATNIISVTFYQDNPQDAATILRVLLDQYLLYRTKVHYPEDITIFFTDQTKKFKRDLHEKGEELIKLIEKTNIPDPKKQIENNIFLKKDLELQLNQLKSKSIEKQLYIEHLDNILKKEDVQFFSFIKDNLPISNLSNKLQEILVERGKALRNYQPDSEKVKSIDRQIRETYSVLKSEVESYKENHTNELTIINKKIASLMNRINQLDIQNVKLQRQIIDAETIVREAELMKASYETFARRREESKIRRGVDTERPSYISIISKPSYSETPAFPNKKLIIPLGLFVGFTTGCSLAFLRDFFDHSFKNMISVEENAKLPVIMSLPLWKKNGTKLS